MADRAGAFAQKTTSNGASSPPETRTRDIYLAERKPLNFREALTVMKKAWPFFAAHRKLVALKSVIAVLSTVLFLITPWPMKIIIDNVIDGHPLRGIPAHILMPLVGNDRAALLALLVTFLFASAILCGISGDDPNALDTDVGSGGLDQAGASGASANNGWSVWNGLLGLVETWITLDLTQRVNQDLRTALYDRFMRSPLGLYSDQKIGDAVFRVMNDSAGIAEVFYRGILGPIMSITMFVCALAVITAQFPNEPMISLGSALMLPLFAIVGALFSRFFRSRAQAMRESGSDVMAAFEERLANVQLIKAYGAESREAGKVDSASRKSYTATLTYIAFVAAMVVVVTPPLLLLIVLGLRHLFTEVIDGRISLGDVVLILSYAMMLATPMGTLGATWVTLQDPIAGLRRVFSVLDRLGEDDLGAGAVDPGNIRSIQLRNVSIAYDDGTPVVRDISFELRPGELVALAGPNGIGKTTIISSLARFIEPCAGAILINAADVRSVPIESLRKRIGFVFQQETLFSRSIADNIRYGAPDASDEQMREAARIAGAAEFIEALPEKYQTMLGRRGARLSVGQKQRIAIARALIRKPDVLLLDEPTAPLDPQSEAALMNTLRELARDRIVLIVAHRASTLSSCDRVLFTDDGAAVSSGSDDELRRDCPAYRDYLAITDSEVAP